MRPKHTKILIVFLFLIPSLCYTNQFATDASYRVCFTPGKNCTNIIIGEISRAQKQILVQAYALTDIKIAKALVKAKKRRVNVQVILDKSQITLKNSKIQYLKNNQIPLFIDSIPNAIAHNKVIIIDGITVIGGSFNYTWSASNKNAENVTIISDHGFAKTFIQNWYQRKAKSQCPN